MLNLTTLLVGIACIADAALQVALALTLSTGQFLIARSIIHAAVLIGTVGVASVFWLRHRHRPRRRRSGWLRCLFCYESSPPSCPSSASKHGGQSVVDMRESPAAV
jgi:hypothetical protein